MGVTLSTSSCPHAQGQGVGSWNCLWRMCLYLAHWLHNLPLPTPPALRLQGLTVPSEFFREAW